MNKIGAMTVVPKLVRSLAQAARRANFQINAAGLTATDADPAPSCSPQRGQPQRPVYTTQAPCSA